MSTLNNNEGRRIIQELNSYAALKARIEELTTLLGAILDAEDEFRECLPHEWEGDPLHDACEIARRALNGET